MTNAADDTRDTLDPFGDWEAGNITTLTALRSLYAEMVVVEKRLVDAQRAVAFHDRRRAAILTKMRVILEMKR